jgi:hypothetical protein
MNNTREGWRHLSEPEMALRMANLFDDFVRCDGSRSGYGECRQPDPSCGGWRGRRRGARPDFVYVFAVRRTRAVVRRLEEFQVCEWNSSDAGFLLSLHES